MTQTAAYGTDALGEPVDTGTGGWLGEVVVQVSMMTVIVALGMALRTSFGFSMPAAAGVALVTYLGLLVLHVLVRRGRAAADLSDEMAHLSDENAALRRLVGAKGLAQSGTSARPLERASSRPGSSSADPDVDVAERAPPRVLDPAREQTAERPRVPAALKAEPPMGPLKPRGPQGLTEPPQSTAAALPERHAVMAMSPRVEGRTASTSPNRGPSESVNARVSGPPPIDGAARGATPSATVRAAAPPPVPGRPRPQGLAALTGKPATATTSAAQNVQTKVAPTARIPAVIAESPASQLASDRDEEPPVSAPAAEDPRAQDIAIMQSLIKGLAEQINGPLGRLDASGGAAATRAQAGSRSSGQAPRDDVAQQVDALRVAADGMRDSLDAPARGVPTAEDVRVVHHALAEAIDAARVDVYLDPILGLDDRRARHFEVSVRLRSESGDVLDPEALRGAIRGSGLTPRIDALTFSESIRLAGEFAARGAAAELFSTASGETLRDGAFHAALNEALMPDASLGARLIMSISQGEVRAFGPAHWQALAALAQSGLRYALVDVVDLDMDFEALAARGFEFIRLDAQVFLQGLPAPHGFVPAADLCRHLSGLGFTLIVSRIAEERELVKVLGFGALLGQGHLFGGPRPIRQERAPARRASTA